MREKSRSRPLPATASPTVGSGFDRVIAMMAVLVTLSCRAGTGSSKADSAADASAECRARESIVQIILEPVSEDRKQRKKILRNRSRIIFESFPHGR